jgi:DnaJ-class molecular chaperone
MDPYSTLGVSKNATQDEIKNAYRSLAKKYHPDLNPGKKDLEAKFKEINTAYEQVGTKEEREKYERGESDAQAQAHARQNERPNYYQSQRDGGRYAQGFGGGGEGGFSQEDIFENLFRNSRHANQAGADELYRMDVDFKESVLGAERTITLPNGKKLQIKIPAGIESGAKLRMKGQGGVGVGSAPAGDAIVEV